MAGLPPEVRDPLHGAIPVSREELAVLDHRLFQRLRSIRQLGFSDLSFPGATHNRYLHSIGAMHLAGRAFDSIFADPDAPPLSDARRAQLRRLVRMAALLHDVGHAPFSHTTEFAMPAVGELAVPAYAADRRRWNPARQATHEDYTIKIVTDSSLTASVEASCEAPAAAVAGLIDPHLAVDPAEYDAGGVDCRPLLQQLISSELDVDRMDYLARDSLFAGVHYGVFDTGWLMNHLSAHVVGDQAFLALQDRAIYAFDDFLIARYHMFLMVYFHYRSVAYEEMLKRYFQAGADGWRIPSDVEDYARCDDHDFVGTLRASSNPWARRIVERREYKMLLERHGAPDEIDLSRMLVRLADGGVPTIAAGSTGVLSKYFHRRLQSDAAAQATLPLGVPDDSPSAPIYVLERPFRGAAGVRARTLEESTALFDRYAGQLLLSRIYVPAEDVERAGRLVADVA